MTDRSLNDAIGKVAYSISAVARAIENNGYRQAMKRTEPIFVFVPSDLKPEDAKELGRILAEAFREGN